jgi:hypothetical protein
MEDGRCKEAVFAQEGIPTGEYNARLHQKSGVALLMANLFCYRSEKAMLSER